MQILKLNQQRISHAAALTLEDIAVGVGQATM
jgi:hypothetical protein